MKSTWHVKTQSRFPRQDIEVKHIFPKKGQTYKSGRRADVMPNRNDVVVELQHSSISQKEIEERTYDWSTDGKIVLWMIDGSSFKIIEVEKSLCYPILQIRVGSPWNRLAEKFSSIPFLFINLFFIIRTGMVYLRRGYCWT